MSAPLVSVIIPVFNSAAFIREALDAVTAQTYENTEIIVVDDGSEDETKGIVSDYVNQNGGRTAIRLISNAKKKGAAGARNTGIDAAKGRYIAFIDADDKWLPDKLEKQIGFMKEREAAFSFTAYEFANESCRGMGKTAHVPESITYRQALKNTTIFTSTVMLDMNRLTKEDVYFPYIASEDSANWWKILKKTGTAAGLDEALTLYRRSGRTLSSNKLVGIKRIWGLYMNEGLSIPYSLLCFICFAFNAVRRRL
ncbi:MAG: glycosyltransferase family 2 protein [Lachnospiraceae bacterium]|nr:glycosyltransferase family 2 protein [Lachnospiraceae bacterium]